MKRQGNLRSRRYALLTGICATFLGFLLILALGLPVTASSNNVSSARNSLPSPQRKISNVTFVAFDTETTGLSPSRDRIVEIAAVRYRDGKIIEEKSWLINPQRSIPSFVQRVHGITPAMVKDKPLFSQVYPEFIDFVGDSVLIAHNAPFDISFVKEEAIRNHRSLPPNKVIDSLRLFRKWFPELKSHKLSIIVDYVKVDTGDAFHRALADSAYLALAFDKGLQKLGNDARLSDLYAEAGGPLGF